MIRRLTLTLSVATAAVAAVALAVPATAAAPPGGSVTVLASGLDDPAGIHAADGRLYLVESASGRVVSVPRWGGAATPLVTGLTSPASVDVAGNRLLVVTGGSEVPDANITGDSTLFTADKHGGAAHPLADLEAYELANNPDGQRQFGDDGAPLDALSNPFAVLAGRGKVYAYVADAGGNDVLTVDSRGTVRTFFVPPLVTTGPCAGAPNNDPQHVGCDSVPTGLAYGPGGTLYVSTLSALVPGQGRVYVLDAASGKVRRVIDGLDGPTGVAVGRNGTVYVSEVTYGAPEGDGPPPADFDPSTIGRIVRIDCHGQRSYASVPMPLGLDVKDGTLYATAWSIASQLGQQHAGQVVRVRDAAFTS